MNNNNRLGSIDSFRALIMLMMIFVIDLASVSGSPLWLHHAGADEDRMGFADIVFPCFMFIIGLSIPHAVKARLDRGDSRLNIFGHIVSRSLSLLLMGLMVVNLDHINAEAMIIPLGYWQLIMVVAIFLIWNQYPSTKVFNRIPKYLFQAAGWVLIGFLGLTYQGQNGSWMQIHWWGILGLLGWSYACCATIYLLAGDRLGILAIAVVGFLALNVNEFIGDYNWRLVISASNYFSVMIGVVGSVIYLRLKENKNTATAFIALASIGLVLIVFGLATRPAWGISKILATPSWTSLCAGISLFLLIAITFIVDIKQRGVWFTFIAAGGTSALTCYFAQYFVYSIMGITEISWPAVLQDGNIGLVRSLLFSVLIIQLVYWAGKIRIKLNV